MSPKSTPPFVVIASLFLAGFTPDTGTADPILDGALVQYQSSPLAISGNEQASGVLAKQPVAIDLTLLKRNTSIGKGLLARDPEGSSQRVRLLESGTGVYLEQTRTYAIVPGVETIAGRVADTENDWFVLSLEGEQVAGQVHHAGLIYDLRYDESLNFHLLTTIDKARMPKSNSEPGHITETPKRPKKANSKKNRGWSEPLFEMEALGEVNASVRVLILYGSDVTGISTLAANTIAAFNESFHNTLMEYDYIVDLAGTIQLGSDLDGECKEEILGDMISDSFPFGSINTWRASNYADVVLTIATTDAGMTTGCSTNPNGRVGGISNFLLEATDPYTVSMDTYALGDLTALHEVGHIMGGGHPEYSHEMLMDYSKDRTEPYARGYIATNYDVQSMMGAYNGTCEFTGLPATDCERLLRWSDPDAVYITENLGIEFTSTSQNPPSADMKDALEVQMPEVADWVGYPDSVPDAPDNFDVSSQSCYGLNLVEWDYEATAYAYQVFKDTSASFTNPVLIHHGATDGVGVNVPNGQTWYIKVRSCNGSGCGDLTAHDTATYFPGCM